MKDINNKVEKTLQSWDNIERFEANPFLYTRIEQKIKNLEQPPPKTNWSWIWQPLLVTVLVTVNFFTIATALSSSDTESQSVYEVIADQYGLSDESSESVIELY